MKCTSCGAEISAGSVNCEYCGSAAPAAEPKRQPESESRSDVFEKIRQSPEYQRRDSPQRRAALPKHTGCAMAFPFVFAIVFTGIAAFMATTTVVVAGPIGALMAIVPIGFVVLGVFMLVHFTRKFRQYEQAPLLARAAILVGKRTQVSGGSGDSSASTAYYLTAEFEDGAREEFQAMKSGLYGRVAEGDAGVLFTRTSIALDFDRVGA